MQDQDEFTRMWAGTESIPRTDRRIHEQRARPAPRAFVLSPALFGVILICFTLPFISVSCGEQHATLTGIQLATGRGVPEHELAFVQEVVGLPEPTALLALAAAVAGLGLGLVWTRQAVAASMITALVATALMWIRGTPYEFDATTTRFLAGYQMVLVLFGTIAVLNGLLLVFQRSDRAPGEARDGPAVNRRNRLSAAAPWLGLAAVGSLLASRPGWAAAIVLGAAGCLAGVIGGGRARFPWRAVIGVWLGLLAIVIATVLTFAPPHVSEASGSPDTTFTGVW